MFKNLSPLHSKNGGGGGKHDRLLDLVEEVSEEDPFAALRLLRVCGVNRFGHVLIAVPPQKVQAFADSRDEAMALTCAVIQQEPPSDHSTHSLPVGAGRARLTSLGKHASGSYDLGAFFRITGPLQQRLTTLGGSTNRAVAAGLQNPTEAANSMEWAKHVCEAHKQAKSNQDSFTLEELHTTNLAAPKGTSYSRRTIHYRWWRTYPQPLRRMLFRHCWKARQPQKESELLL